MQTTFTICSSNYLSLALSLKESFLLHHPNCTFYIFLIDKKPDFILDNQVIEIEEIGIPNEIFKQLLENYNLIELNTSVKPFIIEYLFQKRNCKKIIYLDPDILVYHTFDSIWQQLDTYGFVLTPHIINPIISEDEYYLLLGTINTGVFNLGFFAVNMQTEESQRLIKWWKEHLINYGHNAILNGEFYDQKVMNLLPIFSGKCLISKNFGMNVAEWNLHERKINKKNEQYTINDEPLLFFHFSSIKITSFEDNLKKNIRIQKNNSELLNELISNYINLNNKYQYDKLKLIPCHYKLKPNIHRASRLEIWKYKFSKMFNK